MDIESFLRGLRAEALSADGIPNVVGRFGINLRHAADGRGVAVEAEHHLLHALGKVGGSEPVAEHQCTVPFTTIGMSRTSFTPRTK